MNLPEMTLADTVALVWFLGCWVGYTIISDYRARRFNNLMRAMNAYRTQWMQKLLDRDMRMVDANIVGNLLRSATFFASTSIFILAGLIAILGAADVGAAVIASMPFAESTSRQLWEIKVLLLMTIFIYAFFKFAWSLGQYNHWSIMICAAPETNSSAEARDTYAKMAARIGNLAASHFNRGMRAYYFGLAALTWFIHPWLFMVATTWVVGVLYRREFRSRILRAVEVIAESFGESADGLPYSGNPR